MKILKTKQVKDADAYTMKNEPIESIDLMERAATNASKWILDKLSHYQDFVVFVGPGNNGGDGLVVSRKLSENNKNVLVCVVQFTDKFSDDFQTNYKRLQETKARIIHIKQINDFPEIKPNRVIIDAIFGSGLSRPVLGFPGEVIEKINKIKHKKTISIDVPSGLFGEENHHLKKQNIVKANYTLTFEFPFLSFLFPENQDFVGEFTVIPIGLSQEFISKASTDYYLTEYDEVLTLIKSREKFSHKGNYGHGLLIAGGYARMGAAVLSAKAAHRSGIGLLTAHLPKKCVDIMQISSNETMLSVDDDKKNISKIENISKYDALGIGPAIGFNKKTKDVFAQIIKKSDNIPLVIDADAITILGENKKLLKKIPENTILTPHPKEFSRLVNVTKNNFQRLNIQREFSKKYKVIVVLKGAHTSISLPNGKVHFNSTGNPGMASGGSGDVLTGMILSFLAQGYKPEDAAKIAVFYHGLSADIAASEIGQISLTGSDIIDYLTAVMPIKD